MSEQDQGYYEQSPRLEDRPSLYSATIRRTEYSDLDRNNNYIYTDEQLRELATYWKGQYEGEDFYSPRALREMDELIRSLIYELQARQIVSNDMRDEIEAIALQELNHGE